MIARVCDVCVQLLKCVSTCLARFVEVKEWRALQKNRISTHGEKKEKRKHLAILSYRYKQFQIVSYSFTADTYSAHNAMHTHTYTDIILCSMTVTILSTQHNDERKIFEW